MKPLRPLPILAALVLAPQILVWPAAASAMDEPAPGKTIPVVFRGLWEPEIDDCANVESGSRVVVRAESISYFEEGDEVLAVTPIGADTLDLVVRFETYDGSEQLNRRLVLSDQGETLTFIDPDGARHPHQRCPQGDPDDA